MARKSYVQINGVLYDKDFPEAIRQARGEEQARSSGFSIMPDLPDFVSPIDGVRYSGRVGLKEHNQRHNVVCASDLVGLPPKPAHYIPTPSRREVEARRENLARIIDNYRS